MLCVTMRRYLQSMTAKVSALNNKNRQEVAKCSGASQGANQAAAAARLGYPTSFYGQVTLHLCHELIHTT